MRDKKKKTNKTITLTPEQHLIIENSLHLVLDALSERQPRIAKTDYSGPKIYDLLTHPGVLQTIAASVNLSADELLLYRFQMAAKNQTDQGKERRKRSSEGGKKGAKTRIKNSRGLDAANEFTKKKARAADSAEEIALKNECATKHKVTVPTINYHLRKLRSK
jgi:hypothetical protein